MNKYSVSIPVNYIQRLMNLLCGDNNSPVFLDNHPNHVDIHCSLFPNNIDEIYRNIDRSLFPMRLIEVELKSLFS